MRRKISTKALNDAADGLPDLTGQQMKFVEGLLAGKRASDAYRSAYDCSNSQPASVWALASRAAADVKVKLWLAAAQKARMGSGVLTLENHLSELERLREIALETGNVGAAVQAEQIRGKVAGHHAERLELTISDPIQDLRNIAAVDTELAAKLAEDMGIEWQQTQH